MAAPPRYRTILALLAVLIGLPSGTARPQQRPGPSPPLAILDFSNLGGYTWAGNDRLLIYSRARFRRYDLRWIGLTADYKPEYESPPKDLLRISGWGQPVTFSASPDGRWILGADRGGPRVLDVTTGEAQAWPGEGQGGFWLSDSSGWLEAVHPIAPGDPGKQEQVERDLNAKNMELRLYEPFGDEWPSRTVRKSRFTLPVDAVVWGALGKDELLVASRGLPSRKDIRLTRVKVGRTTRPVEAALIRCPSGGELMDAALAPDGKSVAYLAARPLPEGQPSGTTLFTSGYVVEVGRVSLGAAGTRVIYSQIMKDPYLIGIGSDAFSAGSRPRGLSWRPDGKILSYAVNDQLILIDATP